MNECRTSGSTETRDDGQFHIGHQWRGVGDPFRSAQACDQMGSFYNFLTTADLGWVRFKVMKVLKCLAIGLIAAGSVSWTRAQSSVALPGADTNYTVVLHNGTDVPVSPAVAQELRSDVLEMAKSANYNSRMPHQGVWQHPEPVSEIARHYRELVTTGKYVLVIWGHPQRVRTVLGEITSVEMIVELEKPGVWMCNVDDEGRLVHLGKFRGDLLTKVETLAKQLVK